MMRRKPYILPFSTVALSSADGQKCPRCNAPVFRVPRRFIGRLVSLFIPIRRYRCASMDCDWEGNLKVKQPQGHTQQPLRYRGSVTIAHAITTSVRHRTDGVYCVVEDTQ